MSTPDLGAAHLGAPPQRAVTTPGTTHRVARSSLTSWLGSTGFLAVVVVLAVVPLAFIPTVIQQMTGFLILVILAAMWNALAGYGGLVSVGQQAYIGFGAYAVIFLTQRGLDPYLAIVLAALVSGVLALLVSPLLLRLRGGQFAIGTWVVAEVIALIIVLQKSLGGGTGISLRALNSYAAADRRAYTYWLTLAFTVVLLGAVLLLLRRRTGAALQAIRDDEDAAASVGVRTRPLKLVLFVLAGVGCGAAGALTLANTLFIQPQSIFGVQYTAFMIFMVLVGGLGTFEGPIIGAVVFFFVQNQFADAGAWYLIGLGIVAVAFALFLPRGLWSLAADRLPGPLLPVGYRLRSTEP
jgi:branched-chain amino acid transport system permease protein